MAFSPIKNEIAEQKRVLRSELLARRSVLDAADRLAWSESIARHVVASESFCRAKTVLCYAPVRGEVDPLPIAREAWRQGKQVAFVRSNVEDGTLTFCRVDAPQELIEGAYRIPEPPESAPILSAFDDALCIVPALAFDRRGYRLGYGKGYYDRFLSDFSGRSVGLCYSRLLCDAIPIDAHDVAVDEVFCEEGGWLCR